MNVSELVKVHIYIRGVRISMGKFQSGFLKKHIIFPGCILLPENKWVIFGYFGGTKNGTSGARIKILRPLL